MFLVGSDVAETCGDSFLKGDFLSSGKKKTKQNKMRRRLRDVEHINLGRQAGRRAGRQAGRGRGVLSRSSQSLITRLQHECFIYTVFDTLGLKIH